MGFGEAITSCFSQYIGFIAAGLAGPNTSISRYWYF